MAEMPVALLALFLLFNTFIEMATFKDKPAVIWREWEKCRQHAWSRKYDRSCSFYHLHAVNHYGLDLSRTTWWFGRCIVGQWKSRQNYAPSMARRYDTEYMECTSSSEQWDEPVQVNARLRYETDVPEELNMKPAITFLQVKGMMKAIYQMSTGRTGNQKLEQGCLGRCRTFIQQTAEMSRKQEISHPLNINDKLYFEYLKLSKIIVTLFSITGINQYVYIEQGKVLKSRRAALVDSFFAILSC